MDIKKFNKEAKWLTLLKSEGNALHPLRERQIKKQLLESLSKAPGQTEPPTARLVWRERTAIYMRHAIPIVIVFALLGGTVYASGASKPGDALFTVKKAAEKVELSFAVSAEREAMLKTKFANKRAEELDKISSQRELNLKAHTRAQIEVSNAIDALEEVQIKLSSKGNVEAADAVSRTISKLQNKLSEQQAWKIKLTGKIEAQGTGFVLIQGDQTWKLSGQIDFSAFAGKTVQLEGYVAGANEIQVKELKAENTEIKGVSTEKQTQEEKRQQQGHENSNASSTPSGQGSRHELELKIEDLFRIND